MKQNCSKRIPSFRHHKASGQGYVVLSGTHIYLGAYAKPETQQKYHQVIAEWCANGYRLPVKPEELTVMELCAAYWNHTETHYFSPGGELASSLHRVKMALRALRELYGHSQATDFGPNALWAVNPHRSQPIGDSPHKLLCDSVLGREIGRPNVDTLSILSL